MKILSGIQCTGSLHIGNIFGTISTWVTLQNNLANIPYYTIVDHHSLTSKLKNQHSSLRFDKGVGL